MPPTASPPPGQETPGPLPLAAAEPEDVATPGSRLASRAATGGLVAVLLALSAFSTISAVATTRSAEGVHHGVVAADHYEDADRAFALEAAAERVLRSERSPAASDEFAAAAHDVTESIAAILELETGPHVESEDGHGGLAQDLVAQHDRYRGELPGALAEPRLADGSPGPRLAALERLGSDLRRTVEEEADEHRAESLASLELLERVQHRVVVLTPLVFALGLGLVGLFAAVLRGQRRQIDAQATENRRQALHDSLTGLPNRALLRQRALAELDGRHPGRAEPLALMLIDLDRFKEINDTLGHHYGDVVLQAVAARLREALRSSDTVARLGGDEFAILLPHVGGVEHALEVAARVRVALEASIEADGVSLDVDASIGIVLSGEHGVDVEVLLQHADIAMYVAKERGLGVCVYDHDLNDHSPERLGMLGELRRAIDRGELLLHYQPKVTLPDDQVCGVEALVRWRHPQRGLVPPGEFIPVAERTALIRPLTRWVIDSALEQCRRWADSGRSLQVAVNVSARNLLDDHFVDDVAELVAKWDVAPACLELEVTESAIMSDPERARRVLARLADLGFVLSIDDFGAGYTSLAHLKTLPVHQLKIDRSFVSRMSTDRSDALIVRSVVELGRNLGLTTIAEGVEDRATWDHLSGLGCDVAQGYFLSRPLPADQLEAWFESVRRPAPLAS